MMYIVETEKREGMEDKMQLTFNDLSEAIDLIQGLAKAGYTVKIYGGEEA